MEAPGMKNIDPNRPVAENGRVQLRLVTLMSHPDYSLDKAFNGRGVPRPNRNEELDEMSLSALLINCLYRLEQEIDSGTRWANDYGYAGFMTDAWERGLQQGLVEDLYYHRDDYIDDNKYYKGRVALTLRRARMHPVQK